MSEPRTWIYIPVSRRYLDTRFRALSRNLREEIHPTPLPHDTSRPIDDTINCIPSPHKPQSHSTWNTHPRTWPSSTNINPFDSIWPRRTTPIHGHIENKGCGIGEPPNASLTQPVTKPHERASPKNNKYSHVMQFFDSRAVFLPYTAVCLRRYNGT